MATKTAEIEGGWLLEPAEANRTIEGGWILEAEPPESEEEPLEDISRLRTIVAETQPRFEMPGPPVRPEAAAAPPPLVPPMVMRTRREEPEVPVKIVAGVPQPPSLIEQAERPVSLRPTPQIAEREARVAAQGLAPGAPVYKDGIETRIAAEALPLAEHARRAAITGAAQVLGAGGTAMRYFTQVLGLGETEAGKAIKDTGKKIEQFTDEVGRQYARGFEGRHVIEQPSLLLDPRWLVGGLVETSLSMAPALAAGAATMPAVAVLGTRLALNPAVILRLARIGGALAAGGVGGAQEGAGTYREVLRRGGSEAEAAKAATVFGLASAGLNALSAERILAKLPAGAKAKLLRFLTTGTIEAVTEAAEEPTEAFILGDDMLQALKEGGLDVAVPAFLSGLFAPLAMGGQRAKPKPSLLAADQILSATEAAVGLKSHVDVALERARALGLARPEATVAQEEAIKPQVEAGLARRGIAVPGATEALRRAPEPTPQALVDEQGRPVAPIQPTPEPTGPLRTAREVAGAAPEVPTTPQERQRAGQERLAGELDIARYRDVPSSFYEFARERGRWPITSADPGYMALRREWDELRRPLYEVQGPRLGQWEVVNRVTKEVEAQAPNRAMAQLQANRLDAARMRPMRPEEVRSLNLPGGQIVTPSVTPEIPTPPVAESLRISQKKPSLAGQPQAQVVPEGEKRARIGPAEPQRPTVPEVEPFNPNDIDQLAQFVMAQGGIAPSPTGDLKGEYAAIPLRYKNRRGLNPDLMGQAVSEAAGRTIADHEVLGRLAHLGRLRAEKAASAKAEAAAPLAEIETEELRNLPEDVKVRRISAMTGMSEIEATRLVQRPAEVEGERAERDVAEFQMAARDYFEATPDEPATPEVLDRPHFERFGGLERVTRDLFNGDRDLVAATLETAKQDVAEGRVNEERQAYGRMIRYERTPEGEQALVPGTEARQIPTTPLRPEAPQRPVQETPLFTEREREGEQPRLPGVEELQAAYKPAPATFLAYQEAQGRAPFALYNLTEAIGTHPKGDTLSAETLREIGLEPPATPSFEDWQRTRGVEERHRQYALRPDAKPDAEAKASQLLLDFDRASELETVAQKLPRAQPRGEPAGAGVRTLGVAIQRELAQTGRVDLRGQRAVTAEDVAVLVQVYRKPGYEVMRALYTDDAGTVLATEGLTARLPGAAPAFMRADRPRAFEEIRDRMRRLGATRLWLIHNHESTRPTPSVADIQLSAQFYDKVPGYQGHVIIDSGEYGFIPLPTGQVGEGPSVRPLPDFAGERLLVPSLEHPILGFSVLDEKTAAHAGKEIASPEGWVTLLYRAASGTVRAIQEMPEALFQRPDGADYIRGRQRDFGATDVIAYQAQMSDVSITAARGYVRDGVLLDGIIDKYLGSIRAALPSKEVARIERERLQRRLNAIRVEEPGAPYGADPALLRDLAEYGQEVRRTRPDYESWAEAMRKEFGERVEPHLGRAWDEVRRASRATMTTAGEPVDVQMEKAGPPTIEGLTQPQLVLQKHRQSVDAAAEELLSGGGIVRDKTVLLSDQILDMMVAGKLNLEAIERVLPPGMTVAEFGQDLWRPAIRDAARRLQVLSVLERRINNLLVDGKVPESARAELDATLRLAKEIDEGVVMQAWWRRLDNVRRGMLVTQLATAMRNFESQVGRLGMDVLDLGLQRAIQKAAGVEPSANPWEAIRAFSEVFAQMKPEEFRRLKGEVDQILDAFPRQHDRLFGTYSSDIMAQARERAKGKAREKMGAVERATDTVLTGAENTVNMLNWANRGQEWIVRRAVFQSNLDEALRRRDIDLAELVSRGETAKIPEEAIKVAVDKALELTFATPPKYGTAAWHFVKLMNQGAPLTTSILPFPRFMTNALRFQYEFSPLGFIPVVRHWVSAADRKAIIAGDAKAISRATIGSAMFLTAYAIRLAQDDDNKWYEITIPGEARPVDVRPFNPFASYLFIAELTKRLFAGTLYDKLNWNEIIQGVASANLRAGTGLYALEQAVAGIGELDNLKRAKEFGQRALGEYLAGFLMPFQQVKDFLAPFITDMAQVKDRSLEPFLAPLKDRLPGLIESGLAEPLPPAYSPTRAEPIRREAPALRQVTGVTLAQEKNPAEKELARFQFDRKEILPKSGDPLFDNLWAKHMGALVEERLVPYVQDEAYITIRSDAEKMNRLRKRLVTLRAIAKGRATREIRSMGEGERLKAMKEEARPRRERFLREERRREREEAEE